VGPRKHELDGAQIPHAKGQLLREGHARLHSVMSCAKMAEPIELSFGLWTQVGQRKQSKKNNWKWHCQKQGSVGVYLTEYNLTTIMYYSSNQVPGWACKVTVTAHPISLPFASFTSPTAISATIHSCLLPTTPTTRSRREYRKTKYVDMETIWYAINTVILNTIPVRYIVQSLVWDSTKFQAASVTFRSLKPVDGITPHFQIIISRLWKHKLWPHPFLGQFIMPSFLSATDTLFTKSEVHSLIHSKYRMRNLKL